MAETFKKSKVQNLCDLIQIFLEQNNEKLKSHGVGISERPYLTGQIDAYKLVLKIIEKDFELTPKNK